MMLGQPGRVAALIINRKRPESAGEGHIHPFMDSKGKETQTGPAERPMNPGMMVAADEMMDAFKSRDHTAFVKALSSFIDMKLDEPSGNSGHNSGHEEM